MLNRTDKTEIFKYSLTTKDDTKKNFEISPFVLFYSVNKNAIKWEKLTSTNKKKTDVTLKTNSKNKSLVATSSCCTAVHCISHCYQGELGKEVEIFNFKKLFSSLVSKYAFEFDPTEALLWFDNNCGKTASIKITSAAAEHLFISLVTYPFDVHYKPLRIETSSCTG